MEQLPGLDTVARMEQLPGWNNYLGSILRLGWNNYLDGTTTWVRTCVLRPLGRSLYQLSYVEHLLYELLDDCEADGEIQCVAYHDKTKGAHVKDDVFSTAVLQAAKGSPN